VKALQRPLLKVRMHFDLVDGRDDGRLREQALKVIGHEVAHADRAYLAVSEQRLERAIRAEGEIEPGRQRLMQEQQVEALDTKLTDALVERVQGRVVAVLADPDLRLEEHVIKGPGTATAFSDLTFVGIRGGRVDEPLALRER